MPLLECLHDRIARVVNTTAFEEYLDAHGSSLIEFQATWNQCKGEFSNLPEVFQGAILAGEAELNESGAVTFA
ncbi:hypothetical protein DES53_108303 [Roseimicrobium gellanilyticum]|uniref:Uncharacterized protein n=1 Tax=Roseimicrobium gellanilyticum TaxID=748857 RepID=A0A366HDV8_9BACT|nr:hypothetical protein DES53_108303 [Roseimicrobium gellanilyticum]